MTPISLMPTWWLAPVLLLAWGGCGFYLGDQHSNASWLAKQAVQERAAREVLQAAQARGDALATGLLTQQAQIDQLNQESHRAITQATSGRTCLDSAALRVLKRAPGITVMPQAASSPAAAGEPTEATGGDASEGPNSFSTDTQVATWAIDAGAQFETCRTRLDALIDWHTTP